MEYTRDEFNKVLHRWKFREQEDVKPIRKQLLPSSLQISGHTKLDGIQNSSYKTCVKEDENKLRVHAATTLDITEDNVKQMTDAEQIAPKQPCENSVMDSTKYRQETKNVTSQSIVHKPDTAVRTDSVASQCAEDRHAEPSSVGEVMQDKHDTVFKTVSFASHGAEDKHKKPSTPRKAMKDNQESIGNRPPPAASEYEADKQLSVKDSIRNFERKNDDQRLQTAKKVQIIHRQASGTKNKEHIAVNKDSRVQPALVKNGRSTSRSNAGATQPDVKRQQPQQRVTSAAMNSSSPMCSRYLYKRSESGPGYTSAHTGHIQTVVEGIQASVEGDIQTVRKTCEKAITDVNEEAAATGAKLSKLCHSAKMKKPSRERTKAVAHCQKKKDLKTSLMSRYQAEHGTLSLSPIVEERDADILQLYVTPVITKKGRQIQSFRDFFPAGVESGKTIYISAEAGMGKTAFCKFVTTLWCKLQTPDELSGHEELWLKHIDSIGQFEFLFFVQMREANMTEYSVDDIIKEHIINYLGQSYFDSTFIQRILNECNCLVILDGLDEWRSQNIDTNDDRRSRRHRKQRRQTHPSKEASMSRDYKYYIPSRGGRRVMPVIPNRPKCTVLITTRSYGESRIKQSSLASTFTIKGIDSPSRNILIERVTRCLNTTSDNPMDHKEFMVSIKKFRESHKYFYSWNRNERKDKHVSSFVSNPIVVLQLLCLWYDRRFPVKSKTEIYRNILEMLFVRACEKANPQLSNDGCFQTQDIRYSMPDCFRSNQKCTDYAMTILALGRLAFETVFRFSELVFDECVVKACNVSDDDLRLGQLTGILSKVRSKSVSQRNECYSFVHKSYQEMLCAVYMSSLSPLSTDYAEMMEKIKSCTQIVERILVVSDVFIFICGMNVPLAETLSLYFADITSAELRTNYTDIRDVIADLQHLLIAGHQECFDNGFTNAKLVCQHVMYGIPFEKLNVELSSIVVKGNFQSNTDELSETISAAKDTLRMLFVTGHNMQRPMGIPTLQSLNTMDLYSLHISNRVFLVLVTSLLNATCSISCNVRECTIVTTDVCSGDIHDIVSVEIGTRLTSSSFYLILKGLL